MKAIILCAGYGTRLLPITKAIPKELLPLNSKPCIHYIINELKASGVKDILIVTSRRKKALEDYIDHDIELESRLSGESLNKLNSITKDFKDLNIFFKKQDKMLGTAHAISISKSFIQNDPFILVLPDDITISNPPLTKQLIDIYNITEKSVIAIKDFSHKDKSFLTRYGIVDIKEKSNYKNILQINKIIEKPSIDKVYTKLASIGRYLLTPDFTKLMYKLKINEEELILPNIINKLASKGSVYCIKYTDKYYDVGTSDMYINSILSFHKDNL